MEKNPKTMMGSLKRHLRAFSIAELAIILSLIGFVSSVAVGTVVKHVENEKMEFANVVTNNEVAISLADMHASEELLGLQSEEEFANKLQKHYDVEGAIINKDGTKSSGGTAALADMTYDQFVGKNFAKSYQDGDKVIKASDFNTVLKTAKGVSIALTYNKTCSIGSSFTSNGTSANAYTSDARNAALSCIEGIYDVNGSKGPNKLGVDVGVFTNVKGDCEGNFVMDANGSCGKVCALTTTNCKAENKTLNKETCACECTVSCPKGQSLDKATCTCKCDTEVEFNEHYCRLDSGSSSSSCTPIPKNFLTPAKCISGGGKWTGDNCNCNCDAKDCKSNSFGYGWADPNAYCDCKCPFQVKNAEFDKIVRQNAMKDGLTGEELEKAVQRTIPANYLGLTAAGNCYACDPRYTADGNVTYEVKNGYCAGGCRSDAQSNCDQNGGFFKWVSFNANNPKDSCKCVCNSEVKKAEAAQLNAELHTLMKNRVLLMNDVNPNSYTPTDWGKYRNMSLRESSTNTWDYLHQAMLCGKDGRRNDWVCAYRHTGNHCTYCPDAGSRYDTNVVAYTWMNKGVPTDQWGNQDLSKLARYEFDDSRGVCGFKFVSTTVPTNITSETHFHGVAHIWYGFDWQQRLITLQEYASAMGIALPESISLGGTYNPNWNRPSGVNNYRWTSDFTKSWWWQNNMKVALASTYRKWGDPIVLNYTNKPSAFPEATSTNVNFKLAYDGEGGYTEVATPWIKTNPWDIHQSHVFLTRVNESDPTNLVPDVSYMFSDQKPDPTVEGSLFTTGLDQLRKELDTTTDELSANITEKAYGVNTGLINKNDAGFDTLRIWWDKNTDAKATKDEIQTLDEAKITEINTYVIRQLDKNGEPIQDENAVYGITGQYKRLIEIGDSLDDKYVGDIKKGQSCTKECIEYKNVCSKYECKRYGMFGSCREYYKDNNHCTSWKQECAREKDVCVDIDVNNNSKTRYVEPVYNENGKQILNKWKQVQSDREIANAEAEFQAKVDAEYQIQKEAYDKAAEEVAATQQAAYDEAYEKAYQEYISAWQEAVNTKKVAATFDPKANTTTTTNKGEEVTEPTEDEEATDPAEGEEVTEPTEDEEATEPAEGEEVTEPTEDEEATEPAEGEEATEPAEGEEATEPTEDEEATDPAEDEEVTEPTEEVVDEDDLSKLDESEAIDKAKALAEEAGDKAKAEVEVPTLTEPSREAIEAELAKDFDVQKYYLYTPRQLKEGATSAEYNEAWYVYKEDKAGNVLFDEKADKTLIKVYKIGKKYYKEEIYSLSDVLFKF